MILERLHVGLVTLQVHLLEVCALGQRTLAVAHSVTLQIGFGRHVETVLVAKVIPAGIVGIVTGAHSVDIQLLHNLDVLNHTLHRDNITAVGV